jgi:hypothetical protein
MSMVTPKTRPEKRKHVTALLADIEEHLRDVIILADQHHLGCRIGVG